MASIDLNENNVSEAETERIFALPEATQIRIFELIDNLVNQRWACCKFTASKDLKLRRELASKYHGLKKDLMDLGMDANDTILLRLRKEHLGFQQKMLSADFLSLQLDLTHMFEICIEEASTS